MFNATGSGSKLLPQDLTMKTLPQWLTEYGASHRDASNKLTHWVGIPLIVFAVFAGLKAIPAGDALLNPATLAAALALGYYALLSWRLALGMALVFWAMYALILPLQAAVGVWLAPLAVVIFVVGWALQFLGHMYEGVKPSFFKDLQFLMIGPLWLLADVYRRLNLPLLPTAPQN